KRRDAASTVKNEQSSNHQVLQAAGAVAEAVDADAHALEHGQVQVGDGRIARIADMTVRAERSASLACEENGEVVVVVAVAVEVARAVENHAVVEQRALAFADG